MESQQQGKYCLQKCIAVVLNMLGLFQATPTKDGGSLNPVRDLETRNAKGVETLQVEIEAGVASTSSLGHVRAGCGRHGLRRKRPGHVIKTAVHRFPITAVEAFWQQAKDQVTKINENTKILQNPMQILRLRGPKRRRRMYSGVTDHNWIRL